MRFQAWTLMSLVTAGSSKLKMSVPSVMARFRKTSVKSQPMAKKPQQGRQGPQGLQQSPRRHFSQQQGSALSGHPS